MDQNDMKQGFLSSYSHMHKNTSESGIEVLTKSKNHHKSPTLISSGVTWKRWFAGIDRNKIINQFTAFGKENTWDRWCKCCILMVVVKSILYSSSSRFSKLQGKKKKKNTLKKKVQIHTAMLIPICMEEAVNRNSNATPGLPVHC